MRSVLPILLVAACGGTPQASDVAAVLDDFHDAAAKADEARYFAHFAPDGVFLGTDATERWTVDEFRKYVHPHFERGNGWRYEARDRFITFSPGGEVAWFDEMLDNTSYGELRGTGALRRIEGAWRITQYNLTFTVPNDAARDVVARIRGSKRQELRHEGRSVVLTTKVPGTKAGELVTELVLPAMAPYSLQLLYEDGEYSFWNLRYGYRLFVFRKQPGAWMQIRGLATAGATLGRAKGGSFWTPTWDHSSLRDEPFVDLPHRPGLIVPDNVVGDTKTATYRLQFHSKKTEVETWPGGRGPAVTPSEFVIDKRDLDAAFIE